MILQAILRIELYLHSMKPRLKPKKPENTSSGLKIENIKTSLFDEIKQESNPEEDEFILDGVHFKLATDENPSKKYDATNGANINQLSKQINDLHTLTFSDTKDLSGENLKNKMKNQILLKVKKSKIK